MKKTKRLAIIILALIMVLMMSQAAFAETYDGGTFSYDGKEITNNDAAKTIDKAIANLQPGDEVTFTFTYKNDSKVSTEWYLMNEVIKTLEEAGGTNGGYTYELINNGKKEGTVTIFSSDAVAGEDSENPDTENQGLKTATDATGTEWIYIDTLEPGQYGTTTLKVALDGESQANSYMLTDGQLRIVYGVEDTAVGEDIIRHVTVKTGDETNLMLPVAMLLGAIILLALTVLSGKRDRKDGEA